MTSGERLSGPPEAWSRHVAGAWLKLLLVLVVAAALFAFTRRAKIISEIFFIHQDLPIAITALPAMFLLILPRWRLGEALTARLDGWFPRRGLAICIVAAVFVTVAAMIGWNTVYQHYPLSMDEFWATFDARIFGRGSLLAPVAPPWRPFVPAMQPMWRLVIPDNIAWASTYLPLNAALRAGFGLLGSQALSGPVWAGLSILLIFGLARRLWPDRPDAAVVVTLLLATSSQLIVTAMSPYAMSAHLALNLLWLWLFLRERAWAQAAAVLIAFVATGLHQFVFHPMFAAPFVLQLWLARKWRPAIFHSLAYLLICLFWLEWWPVMFAVEHLSASGAAAAARGATANAISMAFNPVGWPLMSENLARFVLWQNPLVAPLALIAAGLAWRERGGPAAALAAGLVLAMVLLMLVTPFQGHGWGYRYLHGFIGSLCLLAGFAWVRITPVDDPPTRARAWAAMALASVIALCVWLPVRLVQVHDFIRPYARAEQAIAGSGADVVIVDPQGLWYADDLVRNDPFLQKGPKVMHRLMLSERQVEDLCARYRVAWFDRASGEAFGMHPGGPFTRTPPRPPTCGVEIGSSSRP